MIRRASEKDLPDIKRIIIEAFGENTIHFMLERKFGILGDRSWDRRKADEIENFFRNHPEQLLVSELGGRIVGFVSFTIDEDRDMGVVQNNAVDPKYQGRGIGTSQIIHVLGKFMDRGLRIAEVSTGLAPGYAAARHMYEKCGFRPTFESVTYHLSLSRGVLPKYLNPDPSTPSKNHRH